MSDDTQQTLGQRRVKAEFNPAKNGTVDQLKNVSAKMIDIALNGAEKDSAMVDHTEALTKLLTVNLEQDVRSEKNRLSRIAMKHFTNGINLWDSIEYGDQESIDAVTESFETGCMYAVKWCFTD